MILKKAIFDNVDYIEIEPALVLYVYSIERITCIGAMCVYSECFFCSLCVLCVFSACTLRVLCVYSVCN